MAISDQVLTGLPRRARAVPTRPFELADRVESAGRLAHVAQSVEHFLGKEEVSGSNPDVGSNQRSSPDFVFVTNLW